MNRHNCMRPDDLQWHLGSRAPRAVYYSSAYFQDPGAEKMKEKGWMGADLIFDIDCDHLIGADRMDLETQLDQAKARVIKLLHGFLFPDFGIDPDHVTAVFSGGRGYHVHVRDPQVWDLGQVERREIADYLAAVGMTAARDPRRGYKDRRAEGWEARLAASIDYLVVRLGNLPLEQRRAYLRQLAADHDFGDVKLTNQTLGKMAPAFEKAQKWFFQGTILELSDAQLQWLYQAAANIAALPDFDRQCTYDVHRLIRVPGTLHSGTGFLCREVALSDLETFDPFTDAVVFPSNTSLDIHLTTEASVRIGNDRFDLGPGAHTVPERVGIFLIAQRRAVIA